MVKLTEDLVLARCRSSDLESVRKINCWGSELDDISIMRKLINVEVVSLSVNDITSLEDLQLCKNLQELYIRKNKIANLNEICFLKKLPKLRVLWLADNPCATGSLYRMTVLKNLPNLTKLDNMVVETDELNDAIEQGIELSVPKSSGKQAGQMDESSSKGNSNSASKASRTSYSDDNNAGDNSKTLSLAETNKIRQELGLKPLSEEKIATPSKTGSGTKQRNANIVHAVLTLVKELDAESLETVVTACKDRLETL